MREQLIGKARDGVEGGKKKAKKRKLETAPKKASPPKKKKKLMMKKPDGQLKTRVTSQGNKRMLVPDEVRAIAFERTYV